MTKPTEDQRQPAEFVVLDRNGASVRTYQVPAHKADAIMSLMEEYLVDQTPTHQLPKAATDNLADSLPPMPEGFTKVRGGAALHMARELHGLTQLELARELRVSQADLSKMETGKRPIGKRLARKFAHRFKMDYRDFL